MRAVDAYSSFIPITFTQFDIEVRDYDTGLKIGQGNKTFSVGGRKSSDVKVSARSTAASIEQREQATRTPAG